MVARKGFKLFLVVAIFGAMAAPAMSVTDACRQNPNHCQSLELCAIIGNGKYSQRFPQHAKRLADTGAKCVPDLTPRGFNPSEAPKLSALQVSFGKLSADQRKTVQYFLRDGGHYDAKVDGLFGANTRKALIQYGNELGGFNLSQEREADRLLRAILSSSAKQQGNSAASENPTSPDLTEAGFGTGFFVSSEGHVISNHHVVNGCAKVTTRINGAILEARLVANDPLNDLALLKFETNPSHVFGLTTTSPYPLQEIVVVGFPFGEQVSSTVKFTRGIVSSVAGLANNFSQIQVDAAMQPGNSGGPILDENGNVVAVSVSKLSLKKTIEAYGVVPENINFGIKASLIRNLLDGNSVIATKESEISLELRQLAVQATNGVVLLTCFMPIR